MRFLFWLVIALVLLGLAFVRLAPHDIAAIHVPIEADDNRDFAVGAIRVIDTGPDGFEAAVAYLANLPRTQALAGGVDTGRVTFVTRSQVIGFPDYTTVEFSDGTLKAHARLRFGGSDLGVNRERLEGLVAALK